MTEWKLAPVEPTPAMLQDGTAHCGAGMFGTDDEARKVWAAMLAAAPTDPTAEYTPEQARECQHWRGMDGATAWHLIDRHAAGWGDIGRADGCRPGSAGLEGLTLELTGALRR